MAIELPRLISFILLLLLACSATAQSYSNVTLGSSLTANGENSSWLSPSGDFAFGFQQIGNRGYLLAIWFDKIPEKTVVWSANGDDLAPEGSTIQLTTGGSFLLSDPNGKQIWAPNLATGGGNGYAAMLDSGNFVLAGNNASVTLWQSFDDPSDTILPTQVLNQSSRLVARYSETNFSMGRFALTISNGNLALYTTNLPLYSLNNAYWETKTTGSGFRLIFNQSGNISLTATNGTELFLVSSNGVAAPSQFYQRAILEYDGVLTHYVYPKSSGTAAGRPMRWSSLSSIPSNICTGITQSTGGGVCGFNGYCTLGTDQRPICECPSGYTFFDPNDEMSGCKPSFAPQNCDDELKETELFRFVEMPYTDWPLSDYENYQPVTEDWCREVCLNDCFCAVVIFRTGSCWKKKIPLSNGRKDPDVGGKALIKVRVDNSTSKSRNPEPEKKDQTGLIMTGSVLLGSSVFLNFLLLLSTLVVVFNRRKILRPVRVLPGMNLRNFSYEELEEATEGFKEELGQGAFSTVYKGVLKQEDGSVIAVKRLDKGLREGEEKEFEAEMSAICRTNHKNLVKLIGFCKEGKNHRLLVYEFMINGSLASFLFKNPRPNWFRRIQIAFGTARGLCYLHDECSTQIIHCDIKPQNVLLDDNFSARISDFGLAKLLNTDQTRTTTGIRGTKGYVAPEWFKNMAITAKVDVYSFGILLLEIVCCRKNVELDSKDESESILADWACDCYREGRMDVLVEKDEEAMDDLRRVEKFVMIAIWCIQDDPSLRPTMKKVTQMLEGAVEVSAPPDPSSFISSI